jgi:hypothetical protein
MTPTRCECSRGVIPMWVASWMVPFEGILTGLMGAESRFGTQRWKRDCSWLCRVRRLSASPFFENYVMYERLASESRNRRLTNTFRGLKSKSRGTSHAPASSNSHSRR